MNNTQDELIVMCNQLEIIMCPKNQRLIIALLKTCMYIVKELGLEPTLYLKPNN
jgi:hypothetical protein